MMSLGNSEHAVALVKKTRAEFWVVEHFGG